MLVKLSQSIFVAFSLFASAAYADFLPPNDLYLQDNQRSITNVNEGQFNDIIDEAIAYYGPFLKKNFNANLVVNRLWTDSTVNASANQFFNTWTVNMYGGMARRPEVTADSFAIVLCHEFGHHLGGYPFKASWAASEGEADYFATQSCTRDLWKDQVEKNALARAKITKYSKAECDKVWSLEADQDLCYRTMIAGDGLGKLLAVLTGSATSLSTPSKKIVGTTNIASYPDGQCRLDTYAEGALCTQDFDATMIPGKDLGSKRNSASAEKISGKYTCLNQEFDSGLRPACWFKPLL